MALESEFVGSNTSHGKVVFLLAFFFIFIFMTTRLFSDWCVPCGLYLGCNTSVGSTPSHGNKLSIEINLSLREDISMKKT